MGPCWEKFETLGVEETAAEARWLEELGYEYVGSWGAFHAEQWNPPGPSSAVLPVLAVAAGATSTIRLLSSVVLVPDSIIPPSWQSSPPPWTSPPVAASCWV